MKIEFENLVSNRWKRKLETETCKYILNLKNGMINIDGNEYLIYSYKDDVCLKKNKLISNYPPLTMRINKNSVCEEIFSEVEFESSSVHKIMILVFDFFSLLMAFYFLLSQMWELSIASLLFLLFIHILSFLQKEFDTHTIISDLKRIKL